MAGAFVSGYRLAAGTCWPIEHSVTKLGPRKWGVLTVCNGVGAVSHVRGRKKQAVEALANLRAEIGELTEASPDWPWARTTK